MTFKPKNIFWGAIVLMASFTHFTVLAKEKNMTIKNAISTYQKALNASDTKAIMELYGESSIFMPQHAPAQIGKDNIKAAYDNVFFNIKLNVEFTIHDVEELGDTAWVRTTSAGKTTILGSGGVIAEGNNELFVFKKENEQWKIHRYIFATTNLQQ